MKRKLYFVIAITFVLLGFLLIPITINDSDSFFKFIGRLHPLILHVPIGAILVLFFLEIVNTYKPQLNLDSACKLILWFSVFSIIPALFAGFLLASSGNYNEVTLSNHKWLGWFTALTCVWLLV